jgi:hypothetical protein
LGVDLLLYLEEGFEILIVGVSIASNRTQYGFEPLLFSKTGMMVRPPNLEDIFVELTGRQLD